MRKLKKSELLLALALVLVLALALLLPERTVTVADSRRVMGYEDLFDPSEVHTLDIRLEEGAWESFLATATDKEYIPCTVVIDGAAMENVGLRAKGNSSMQRVTQARNGRYSLKIEFDHYVDGQLFNGLDKLALNNLVQDDSAMRDYLAYRMMGEFGVAAPLCSYIYITVNGEDWGLFLAVEAIEDSFLQRNFGLDHGELYKPDSFGNDNGDDDDREEESAVSGEISGGMPMMPRASGENAETGETAETSASIETAETAESSRTSREMRPSGGGGGMGGMGVMGSADLLLQYVDDSPESYPNIFGAEKTDVSKNDRQRLIASLKQLTAGENIPQVVDMEQVIRYFVVHGFVCNWDSYTGSMHHNYYLYEKAGQLSMIPWDYNEAYGSGGGGSSMSGAVNRPLDTPVSSGTVEERPILAWIFADEAYTEQYHTLYDEFLREFMESGEVESWIRDAAALIAPYMEKDPTAFCTYEAFLEDVEWMSTFFALRSESLRGQLDGTIPSTQEGQAADSSALIDASALGSSSGEMRRPGASGEASGETEGEETGEVIPDPNPPVT